MLERTNETAKYNSSSGRDRGDRGRGGGDQVTIGLCFKYDWLKRQAQIF